jgi:hypothetical protein
MSSSVLIARNIAEDLATSIIRFVSRCRDAAADELVENVTRRIAEENKTLMGRLFKLQTPTRLQILNANISDPWIMSWDLQRLDYINDFSKEEFELAKRIMKALSITTSSIQLSLEDTELLAWGQDCKKWLEMHS